MQDQTTLLFSVLALFNLCGYKWHAEFGFYIFAFWLPGMSTGLRNSFFCQRQGLRVLCVPAIVSKWLSFSPLLCTHTTSGFYQLNQRVEVGVEHLPNPTLMNYNFVIS